MEKNLEYYMNLKYPITIETEEDGTFFISYPDLLGCFSCGDTIEEAIKMGEDARCAWMKKAIEKKAFIPEPRSIEDCPDNYKIHLPKSLYRQLAVQSARENTSMNQYCVYLLSKGVSAEEVRNNK